MNCNDRSVRPVDLKLLFTIFAPCLFLIASGLVCFWWLADRQLKASEAQRLVQSQLPEMAVPEFATGSAYGGIDSIIHGTMNRTAPTYPGEQPTILTIEILAENETLNGDQRQPARVGDYRIQEAIIVLAPEPDRSYENTILTDPTRVRRQRADRGFVMPLVNRMEGGLESTKGSFQDRSMFVGNAAVAGLNRNPRLIGFSPNDSKAPTDPLKFIPYALGASLFLLIVAGGYAFFAVRVLDRPTEPCDETDSAPPSQGETADILRTSEATFRELAELLPLVIYEFDGQGIFTFLNQAGLELTGVTREELAEGKNVLDLLSPDDRDKMASDIERIRSGEVLVEREYSFLLKDGSTASLYVNSSPMVLGGKTIGIRGLASSISQLSGAEETLRQLNRELEKRVTERTTELAAQNERLAKEMARRLNAELQIQDQNEFLSSVLESITHPFYIVDADSHQVVMANSAAQLDLSSDENTCYALTHRRAEPCTGSEHPCPLQEVTKTGKPVTMEHVHYDKAGNARYVEIFAYPLRDAEGRVAKMIEYAVDITDRRKAEQALRESERRLSTLLSNLPGIAYSCLNDRHWTMKFISDGCSNLTGYNPADLIENAKLAYNDLIHPDDRQRVWEEVQGAVARGGPFELEYRITDKSGKTRFVWEHGVGVTAEDGTVIGLEGYITDVTERRQAERALRENEERFRKFTNEASTEGIAIHDEGIILDVNETFAAMLGYKPNELLGANALQTVAPESREIVNKNIRKQNEIPYEAIALRKDGTTFPIEIVAKPVPFRGKLVRAAAVRDLTEQKKAQQALRESRERYQALFEQSPDAILIVHPEGQILDCNQSTCDLFGAPKEEIIGANVSEYYWNPADRDDFRRELDRKGFVRNFSCKVRRKGGTQRLCQLNSTLWRDSEGNVQGYLSIARDVTEQKQAEEDRLRLFTAIEQSDETIVITDVEGTIQYTNPAFERVTGYSREEAIGANPRLLKSGRHGEAFYKEMWDALTAGKVWIGHIINKKKDGTLFEEEASISPIKNETGEIVNYVAVKRDVTKEIGLQKQLVKAQRMESIATLAAGIAHDFNNLLAITAGYSELLLVDKEQEEPGYEELQAIHHASKRGADLVQRILTFSRKVETKPRPTNLNDEVESAKKLLDRTIPRMIDIELKLADNLPMINVDPGQMEQILMNLAINAKDAMHEGGRLTIQTEQAYIDEEYCKTHLYAAPGDYVMLQISDTGHGIDKEYLDRIFEPFYSTKKPGEGTGLGLAMVFGIVKSHKGFVNCYSEPGLGTTFKIYFPVKTGPEAVDLAKSIEIPAFGTECVLLVDDEELIRNLGTRLLKKAGYTVLTACNGNEALEIFQQEKDNLALVILDLIMPETGGKQCLEQLLRIDPDARILVASGYAGDLSVKEILRMGAKGFISKPFQSRKLLQAVRKTIDEG